MLCSGNILTRKTILTAAHCFNSKSKRLQPTHIRAGANYIDSYFAEQRQILEVNRHPDYDSNRETYYFDLAIITIEKEFEFNSKISPICLPKMPSPHPGSDIGTTVQGWGPDKGRGKLVQVSEVTVIIRSKAECDDRIDRLGESSSSVKHNIDRRIPQLTTDALFCADANLNNKTGVCYGDSGGPAIKRFEFNKKNCHFYLHKLLLSENMLTAEICTL